MTGTEDLKKKGEELKEKGKQLKENVKDFAKRGLSGEKDAEMPERDVTGECEGECRDRVKEGEKERQESLESEETETPEEYPKAPGANKRNDPPGSLGGKV